MLRGGNLIGNGTQTNSIFRIYLQQSIMLLTGKMSTATIILVLYLCWLCCAYAADFNMFKSYKDAKVKPPQYSKRQTKRAISEYLDSRQMQMMKYRTGRDVPGAMFNERWSGFNKAQNSNPLVKRRRLRGSSSDSSDGAISLVTRNNLIAVAAFMLAVLMMAIAMMLIDQLRSQEDRRHDKKPHHACTMVMRSANMDSVWTI
jgi:hypothetical protein